MTTACETVPFPKPVLMGVAEIVTHVPGSGIPVASGAHPSRSVPTAGGGGDV
jgi:hypothetical protein